METITRHTDPATLDDCGRRIRETVTPRPDLNDAWLEIIDACDAECDQCDGGAVDQHDGTSVECAECGGTGSTMSPGALQVMEDHGIELDAVGGYGIGDYLEGQVIDYRTLRASDGSILEIHLCVGYGGPNVWQVIDATGSCLTEVAWWGTLGRGEVQHGLYARVFEYMHEVVSCS